jgi:hypothetical protein
VLGKNASRAGEPLARTFTSMQSLSIQPISIQRRIALGTAGWHGRIGSVGHRITGRYPGAVNRHHGIGWEFVHVCIDDASRVAFVHVMPNQRKESAVAFLEAAVAYYAKLGIHIERVMTDNGSCCQSKTFRAAWKTPRPSPNLH